MSHEFVNRPLPGGISFTNNCIAGSPDLLVAFPNNTSGLVYRSLDDGLTWTSHASPFGARAVQNVVWNGAYFLASLNVRSPLWSERYAKSTDGASWALYTFTETVDISGSVSWWAHDPVADIWVVTFNWNGDVYVRSSTDGALTWTTTLVSTALENPMVLIHDGTRFCMTTDDSTNYDLVAFMTSVNGTTWTRAGSIDRTWGSHSSLLYNGTEYLTYGDGGPSRSADGTSWSNLTHGRAYAAGVLGGNFYVRELDTGNNLVGASALALTGTTIPNAPADMESVRGFSASPEQILFRSSDSEGNQTISMLRNSTPSGPFWTNHVLTKEVI